MLAEDQPTKKVLVKLRNTTHYEGGKYELKEGKFSIGGDIYEYHDIVSVQFNQLKAKLFNLVESSCINEIQSNAMKGLIRGFCNSNYSNIITDLEGWLKRMGFEIIEWIPTSNPLGKKKYKVKINQ